MKVSKKAGIALFVTTAVIMAVLIVFHKNLGPAADPGQELAKKIISCVVIAAACFAFIHWYDKFTGTAGGAVPEPASDLETGQK